MPLRSEASSSRDTLNAVSTTEDRRRTGRYVAVGALLAITLLALHHALLRDASTVTSVFIPAIIMVSYVVWILYSAHRDRRKALRSAAAMQLTEIISVPARSGEASCKNATSIGNLRKDCQKLAYGVRESRENPAFSSKDEAV